jgi:hypothetical protein
MGECVRVVVLWQNLSSSEVLMKTLQPTLLRLCPIALHRLHLLDTAFVLFSTLIKFTTTDF